MDKGIWACTVSSIRKDEGLKADLARYKDIGDAAKRLGFSGHKKPRNMVVGSQYQKLRELALMGNIEAIDTIRQIDVSKSNIDCLSGRYPSARTNWLKRLFKKKPKPENKVYYNKDYKNKR